MRKVVYLMNMSLDGFVEGRDGTFGWSIPDEEVHRFHNQLAREMDAYLYGRRMYETMMDWETMGENPSLPDYAREFAGIWKARPKIVFSTTLVALGPNARLVRGDAAAAVTKLKQQPGGSLAVSGPGLAAELVRLGLIDEYRLVLFPRLVGGGRPFFPELDREIPLRLLDSRSFACGAVYLRYAISPS